MHVKELATALRATCRHSLSLARSIGFSGVGFWGVALGVAWSSPALAQAPGASAAPAGSSPAAPAANKPAAAPGAAAAKPAASAAKPKPKRKLPMRACPARVPEDLNPPADVTLEMVLPASGVQSYACIVEKPGEAPDWAPKGPHAMLGEAGNVMGIHSGGPSWQALDGSLVKGSKISSASAPDKSSIVWLLLAGAPSGEGIFSKTTHIQRMDTVGGKPPQGGCDASRIDTRVLVPYRANYYFYREAEPGESVRQCRGAPSKQAAGDNKGKGKDKGQSGKPSSDKSALAGDKAASKLAEKAVKSTSDKSGAEKAAKASTEKAGAEKTTGAKPAEAKPASE